MGTWAATASSQSPGEAYLAYTKAVDRSSSWDGILPLMAAKNAASIRAMPAAERARLHSFFQSFFTERKNLTIISETTTGNRSIVIASFCEEGRAGKDTTPLFLENGAWKVGKGNSDFSLTSCRIAQSPTDTYLAYVEAVRRSSSLEGLLPLLTADNAAPIRRLSDEQRRDIHDVLQPFMINRTKLQVVSEKRNGGNAIVVSTYCVDGMKGVDATPLTLERGTWGIGKGSSKLGSESCAGAKSPTKKKVASRHTDKRRSVQRNPTKRRSINKTVNSRSYRSRAHRKKSRSQRRRACGGTFMYRKGRKCVDARI